MRSISRFHDLLKLIPRASLERAIEKHRTDRYSKTLRTRDHLIVMAYAQLSGAGSLREIKAGFNAHANHHHHLHTREVRTSTLADANARRDPAVFADTARALMAMLDHRRRRDSNELLYLLDSTTVTCKGRGCDWAVPTRVRSTQGLKLHLLYEAGNLVPAWHSITATNVNDLTAGLQAPIEPGATYVFDKAYYDFNWWSRIDAQGARFVSRFKTSVSLRVLEQRKVPEGGPILGDEVVCFANPSPGGTRKNLYKQPLRRVRVKREGKPPLVFATNDLRSSAEEIAGLYRERWGIELFFKWIKQHLNIRQFYGQSENAVKIQVLTALITYLLLALQQQLSGAKTTLWEQLAELRAALFQRVGVVQDNAHYNRRRQQIREFKANQKELFA